MMIELVILFVVAGLVRKYLGPRLVGGVDQVRPDGSRGGDGDHRLLRNVVAISVLSSFITWILTLMLSRSLDRPVREAEAGDAPISTQADVETSRDATDTPSITKVLNRVERSFCDFYLQLISIIQGLALSGLMDAVSTAKSPLSAGHWLRVVAVLLLIVVVWQEYMVGCTVFAWVPTLVDSVGVFCIGIVEFALAKEVTMPAGDYLKYWIVIYLVGLGAYANYVYHASHGFPSNADSYKYFRTHPGMGFILCLLSLIYSTLLILAYFRYGSKIDSADLVFSGLTLVTPLVLIVHFAMHWNGPIREARRSESV